MKEESEQYTYLYENPKVLFREQLSIPGVDMFGYANFQSANIVLDTHWHTAKEFVVILDGTQTYYVDDKWYTLHGGDIFMTSPKEPHGNAGLPQNVCEFVFFCWIFRRKMQIISLDCLFLIADMSMNRYGIMTGG